MFTKTDGHKESEMSQATLYVAKKEVLKIISRDFYILRIVDFLTN